MKGYRGNLTTILLAGTLFLGMGATLGAQQGPPDSQQPMEIPPQQYPSQQGGPQQGAPQSAQNDGATGRVSFIHGDFSTQHDGSSDWAAATLNTPVVNGDRLSTGKNSRAEIQLDHANTLRMSEESTANVVNLSRSQIQVQVGQGLVNYDVLRNSDANIEIDTPNVAVRPQAGEGSYRILVNSDGETIVDVRKGSAEISTPQGSTRVERDQRITIEGNADNAQYQVSGAPGRDEWDKWNADRDRTIENAQSWQHTNPYYTGSQDLDAYGHWSNVPDYGDVWFPSADAGWAPYRDGRWVYEPYYGWTWVSYEPWGWAPYHYGRWFVYGGNWGWWPGPVYGGYQPIWAPAYVSFFGFGGGGWSFGFGFGGGFGNVGWLPCGPGDRFYPWYGRGINRVNVVNIYNIHNDRGGFEPLRGGPHGYSNVDRAFSDARVRDGISSMRGDQFGRGAVPRQQSRFDSNSLRQASVITGGNPVSPSRESFRSTDRQVNSNAIPNRANSNQRFYSSNARQGASAQADRSQGGFNRGGATNNAQAPQNSSRPGFRSFGPSNSGQVNSGNRQGGFDSRGNQPQQNMARPGSNQSGQSFHNFGSNNSGNVNRGPAPGETSRQPQQNMQSQPRGFTPPAPQQQSSRPGWRPFTPPSNQSQPSGGGRTYEGQGAGPSRQGYSQPAQPPQQYQNNSRQSSGTYGYNRPALNMQQPVVRPRGGTYSPAPSMRSAPSGGYGGGGYRGGPSGGGYGGGYRGGPSGGSRGGNPGGGSGGRSSSSGGGNSSSGHNRR
ncbi:MAG: FecR domain-containing protein [Acidobacteriia bacterium]|nr:FecR domain-containing protein [Terriglobia bacterium]